MRSLQYKVDLMQALHITRLTVMAGYLFAATIFLPFGFLATGFPAFNQVAVADNADRVVEVWKSASCGCCSKWIAHMRAAGFTVSATDTDALTSVKTRHGVPDGLRSCHTAKVGGYIVEGHVPASDVLQLLQRKPPVIGISVPGMPMGSPGMEMPDGSTDAFDTIAFTKDGGTHVFNHHPAPQPAAK
jgi:hypothetical protein